MPTVIVSPPPSPTPLPCDTIITRLHLSCIILPHPDLTGLGQNKILTWLDITLWAQLDLAPDFRDCRFLRPSCLNGLLCCGFWGVWPFFYAIWRNHRTFFTWFLSDLLVFTRSRRGSAAPRRYGTPAAWLATSRSYNPRRFDHVLSFFVFPVTSPWEVWGLLGTVRTEMRRFLGPGFLHSLEKFQEFGFSILQVWISMEKLKSWGKHLHLQTFLPSFLTSFFPSFRPFINIDNKPTKKSNIAVQKRLRRP